MRTPPADPALAPALTAYATDLTLIGTALRAVEGVSQRDAARFQAGLNRTTAAPSRQTARTATIHSGRFEAISAPRSPGCTPCLASVPARPPASAASRAALYSARRRRAGSGQGTACEVPVIACENKILAEIESSYQMIDLAALLLAALVSGAS
jgi:hypothetical protein